MNRLLLFLTLLIGLSANGVNGQFIDEKLKAQILKIETSELLKHGQQVTDLQFVSFQYKLIPIKDWWKMFYDINVKIRTEFSMLIENEAAHLRQVDSLQGTHKADSLAITVQKIEQDQKGKESFDSEAYFKDKYENADPSQNVYEVLYVIKYKKADREIQRDKSRKAFYQNDLSQVDSFK